MNFWFSMALKTFIRGSYKDFFEVTTLAFHNCMSTIKYKEVVVIEPIHAIDPIMATDTFRSELFLVIL